MPFQGPRVSGVKTGKFYAANHSPHNACGFGASSVTESDLIRFVDAQAQIYSQVVEELTDGHKRTHWMWFIFPQLSGLGLRETTDAVRRRHPNCRSSIG